MRGVRLALPVKDVVKAAFERRLLVVPSADDVVRLLPPLDISTRTLDLGVERLSAAVDDVRKEA
jgi:acetylornithine/N-succinyldiaminopimelate aminotransferase